MAHHIPLANPHMSDEGFELEYIHDAFNKNWIAPLGENVNEFEKEMAFKKAEAARDQANADRNYALAASKAAASSSKKSEEEEEKSKKTGIVFYPTTYKEFYLKTGVSTILTEVEFASSSTYRKAYKSYENYLKEMFKIHAK